MKTIKDLDQIDEKKYLEQFKYQEALTMKLDSYQADFDQGIINEIVLWKLNRYSHLDAETLFLLNQIDKSSGLNKELTEKLLKKLLSTSGIRLPMASTILRFKNPNIYQIIDQRAYRFLTGEKLKISQNIDRQIELYFDYLARLREASHIFNVDFVTIDRVLYILDKEQNKGLNINH